MKRKRRKAVAAAADAPAAFLRGALVTGLLVALQGRHAAKPAGRKVLRHALQGGAALAAGTVAAEAIVRRRYAVAAGAVAAGAVGVVAAEYLIDETDVKERGLGQEEG